MNQDHRPLRAFSPHVSLMVSDLARSVEFYSVLFGVRPAKERPGYAKFSLVDPPLNFSMNERRGAKPDGHLSHLGFEVLTTEEVTAAKERLEAGGIAIREEMGTTCCYAKQDKIWANDPDGNPWEIFVVTDADAERGGSGAGCCIPVLNRTEGVSCC